MSHLTSSESLQKNVRKYIFEHFEEHTTAPVLEQIMRKFGLNRASAFKILEELQSARHVALLAGTQRILMAFPFSSIVTPFKVKVTGKEKEYFANCAWDAVAIHVALGKEQRISSYCHHCSEDIKIHLKDQKVVSQQSDKEPLVY
jgi:alkylmercury lyase-like protein